MIDERQLSQLATTPGPTVIRPLPEVIRRARVLHRRRQSATALAATGLTAALAITGFTLPRWSGSPSVAPAAPAATGTANRDCSGGYGVKVSPAEAPDVLYLPSSSVSGPLRGRPLVREVRPACPRDRVGAVWYAMNGASVTRRLLVEGPHQSDPYVDPSAPDLDEHTTTVVDLHGSPATVYFFPRLQQAQVYWSASDGSKWSAWAEGMPQSGALAAVRALRVTAAGIDRTVQPPALPLSLPLPGGPTAGHDTTSLHLDYGAPNGRTGNWQLSIEQVGNQPFAGAHLGSRRVDVAGRVGWWDTDALVWSLPAGTVAQLRGLDRRRALEVAESLVKVSPDDSRLRRAG